MNIVDFAAGLAHIGIPTDNLEETLLFYTELGFEVEHINKDPANDHRVYFLRLGDIQIETYEDDAPAKCHGAIEHLAIKVTDIDAVYNLACKRGLNTLDDEIHFLPYWENGVKYFTIEGPNKEKVEFAQVL
ncbi:MAG: VOC family protein [Blautia sp.]|nr:VOC family protein [Blautia sp.]